MGAEATRTPPEARRAAATETVRLGRGPVDPRRLLERVASPLAGGNVLFLGTARGLTDGVVTCGLEYEAHEPLARGTLESLVATAVGRFGLVACAVEHRLGPVAIGEASVGVATSAAHRDAAFAAAEWLMERIKVEVPIWKCEQGGDGIRRWVHPDGATPRVTPLEPGGETTA